MPSAVYLHDGEHQITVTFRTEEDKERFKAHYRALDALAARYRDELVAEREQTRQLFQFLIEWDGQDSFRDPDYRDQLQERYCEWVATAEAALATAGGEGATP